MIESTQGNLLEADAEVLVNVVNCVGVMGKGIALQFKQAFPDNFTKYAKVCKEKQMKPGRMLVFETGSMLDPKYIINFPTKRHWKSKSKMEDIDSGLLDMIAQVKRLHIQSIAIPPLGAGLGGLNWSEVKQRIETAFAELPDVLVLLFEPKGNTQHRLFVFPAQCECGHLYLEKYRFREVQENGIIGFCWCGFCRTRRNVYLEEYQENFHGTGHDA